MLKICEKFFAFFWKNDPITVKFLKFCSKIFIVTPIDVLCLNFVKFVRREIDEIVYGLLDKKFCLAVQLSLLRGSRPKSS